MASGYVLLRIFSGPHMGAELVLPVGTHLIGGDDSCDIILQDTTLAPRHATLSIALSETGDPSVHVCPLDGQVLLNDEAVPQDGAAVPERTPCFFGMTVFAWATQEDAAEAWKAVVARLQEKRTAVPVQDSEQAVEPVTLLEDPVPTLEALEPLDANPVGTSSLWVRLREASPRSLAATLLVLLALCGLTFSYEGRVPNEGQRIEEIEKLFHKYGFSTLVVTPMGQGVAVQGVLLNDGERAALLKLAQDVHYPVYLDVVVRGDRVNAIAAAFSSRGFALEVREKGGTSQEGLLVAGYLKDGTVEETVFSAVREDVPGLHDEAVWNGLERKLRHADDVEAVLRPRLKEGDLSFVQVRYLAGKIELAGTFNVEQRRVLDQALAATRQLLDVPVLFEVVTSFDKRQTVSGASGTSVAPNGQASSGSVAQGEGGGADGLPNMQVTGVTLSPMRFISLGTGQRVFEGGLLPGGFVLESIDVKALTLRKDGRTLLYQLRGSNE